MSNFKTAESVTIGHPDKLCDLIADSILDATLAVDPNAHVACEVMATKGHIILAGEIHSKQMPDKIDAVHSALYFAGYDPVDFEIKDLMHEQSTDIYNAVSNNSDSAIFAGDQGVMYGYADNETEQFLPLVTTLTNALTDRLTHAFDSGLIPYLRPDGKAQVTVEYENGKPIRISSIIVSAQHEDCIPLSKIQSDIVLNIIKPVIPQRLIDLKTVIDINPSGRFVEGGPSADTGVTGRKLMVDTYSGLAHHGGGAMSGKDASKVDRSGAYFCRYLAKNIVASGIADRCEVSVSYAIGKVKPTSINIDTFGTSVVSDDLLKDIINRLFDFTPSGIINKLDLKKPIYVLASHHPFGGCKFSWEQTDMADRILQEVKNEVRIDTDR